MPALNKRKPTVSTQQLESAHNAATSNKDSASEHSSCQQPSELVKNKRAKASQGQPQSQPATQTAAKKQVCPSKAHQKGDSSNDLPQSGSEQDQTAKRATMKNRQSSSKAEATDEAVVSNTRTANQKQSRVKQAQSMRQHERAAPRLIQSDRRGASSESCKERGRPAEDPADEQQAQQELLSHQTHMLYEQQQHPLQQQSMFYNYPQGQQYLPMHEVHQYHHHPSAAGASLVTYQKHPPPQIYYQHDVLYEQPHAAYEQGVDPRHLSYEVQQHLYQQQQNNFLHQVRNLAGWLDKRKSQVSTSMRSSLLKLIQDRTSLATQETRPKKKPKTPTPCKKPRAKPVAKSVSSERLSPDTNSHDEQVKQTAICYNVLCGRDVTPSKCAQLKRHPQSNITFCQRCLELYNKNCFCDHCLQVYPENSHEDALLDGLQWIKCNSCDEKWNHYSCEIDQTISCDADMRHAACLSVAADENDDEIHGNNKEDKTPYWCMQCRGKRKVRDQRRKNKLRARISTLPVVQQQPLKAVEASQSNLVLESTSKRGDQPEVISVSSGPAQGDEPVNAVFVDQSSEQAPSVAARLQQLMEPCLNGTQEAVNCS